VPAYSPFYIVPTWDGPAGSYDVCQRGMTDDDGPDEVIFSGTLDECRAEYPRTPLKDDPRARL
jgi:hypothetical protein